MTKVNSPKTRATEMDVRIATEQVSDDADPPPVFSVQIANEQTSLTLDEPRLQAAVRSALEGSSYETATVSAAVVDDPTIHQLNRKYLQHDYPTDILSFVLEDSDTHLEGQLIASAETAIRNAAEQGWSAEDELLLYLIHGALHLIGYRDKDAVECAAMVAAEADLLQKLGVALPKNQSRWKQSPDTLGKVAKS